jgi:hypothetical protein
MKSTEVYVYLTGGLGNQLFQLAAARSLKPEIIYLITSVGKPRVNSKKKAEILVEGLPGPGQGESGLVVGSLDSASSMRSYMGSMVSSSSEEWEEKEVEVEIPTGASESTGMTKSEFFQNALLEALKKYVEETEEYLEMGMEKREIRRWYEGRKFVFSGALDLVTHRSVWEMKCTSMLSKEHQLQLLMYAWFWKGLEEFYQKSPESFSDRERKYVAPIRGEMGSGKKDFHLFNVKTREHLMLKEGLSFSELTDFVAMWVDGKNNSVALSVHLSDLDFLQILEEV